MDKDGSGDEEEGRIKIGEVDKIYRRKEKLTLSSKPISVNDRVDLVVMRCM